ncbi:MAG: ornithine aminomutase subunit alpha [Fusobacteriaceae bacterium]
MKGYLKREDDFEKRRQSLKNLSEEELKEKFWSLAERIVDPMIDIAKTHTTPSIERSILLRMGFSSIEAKPLVEEAINRGLIKYGVGHVVYAISKIKNIPIRDSGIKLLEGECWEDAAKYFAGVK